MTLIWIFLILLSPFCQSTSIFSYLAERHRFFKAIRSDDIGAVQSALDRFPRLINATQKGKLPLHMAAKHSNNYRLVRLLIGKKINGYSGSGKTALHYASERTDPNAADIVRVLLRNRAHPGAQDSNRATPFMIFCYHSNDLALINEFVHYGAKFEHRNEYGRTVFHYAAKENTFRVFSHLLKLRRLSLRDVLRIEDYHMGDNPIQQAVCLNNLPFVKSAIEADPDILFFTGSNRRNFLHYAAHGYAVECIRYLLDKGLRMGLPDKWGGTPLAIASHFKEFNTRKQDERQRQAVRLLGLYFDK